ncbi:unnamed protein product [Chilo suppressalis]|uniref:Uncharacterized protein n=1 Tax=Chilo suppressalis TaxID=168631 RepID=A0ABN8B949_CHISP|nr:unnamed protein product [Chilo suppressalis]
MPDEVKTRILLAALSFSRAFWKELEKEEDKESTRIIRNLTSDIIKDTDQRMSYMEQFKLTSIRTPAYEVGYVTYLIQEDYRKMLDIYNTTFGHQTNFYPTESIVLLQEVENHYWTIEHLCNMLHEIERKWMVVRDPNVVMQPISLDPIGGLGLDKYYVAPSRNFRSTVRRKKFKRPKGQPKDERKIQEIMKRLSSKAKPQTRWWWPLEYGWEIDYYW